MPTLTDDQYADFRQLCGDLCTPENISDARIQAFYDAAYAAADEDATREALTVVSILRRLLGLAINKIDVQGEIQGAQRSQIFDHLKDALKYWEGVAGIGGAGALKVGTLDLALDMTEDDLEWPE
jgi:hypothetical protein